MMTERCLLGIGYPPLVPHLPEKCQYQKGGIHGPPRLASLTAHPPQRTDPPLTSRISPVTCRARSEARKRIGPATSSGGVMRFRGMDWRTFSLKPGSLKEAVHMLSLIHISEPTRRTPS